VPVWFPGRLAVASVYPYAGETQFVDWPRLWPQNVTANAVSGVAPSAVIAAPLPAHYVVRLQPDSLGAALLLTHGGDLLGVRRFSCG
jgi:hypothetical protein